MIFYILISILYVRQLNKTAASYYLFNILLIMKQLMNTRLFLLLADPSNGKNVLTELNSAYDEFATKLLDKLQSETNITKLYYNLSFVGLELVGIRDNLSDRQEKKCAEICH